MSDDKKTKCYFCYYSKSADKTFIDLERMIEALGPDCKIEVTFQRPTIKLPGQSNQCAHDANPSDFDKGEEFGWNACLDEIMELNPHLKETK